MNKPKVHRLEGDLKVCDPVEVDQTHPIETWRKLKMMAEIAEGFEFLKNYKLAATIYGSSRMTENDPVYQQASELAARLSQSGFTIITGGAGGIMEAGNKGAYEAGGQSIGLNIKLPAEQKPNKFLTAEMDFNYFFTRKVMLAFASEVYIFFPGGFGTLNEFFEMVTLVQTRKVKAIPIILYGRAYWQPLMDLLKNHVYGEYHAIDEGDMSLYTLVDSVEEAYQAILRLVNC